MFVILLISFAFLNFELGVEAATNPSNYDARIIDGIQEDKLKYYEVAIVSSEDESTLVLVCTGALIGNRWVLTSAFCAKRKNILTVQYGSQMIDISGNAGKFVRRKFIHPNYNPNSLINDIALLEIEPVVDSTGIKILTIPNSATGNYIGEVGKVSGWGAVESFGPYQFILSSKQVYVTENSYCQQRRCFMNNYKLCTAGRSICEGDQGAPLVIGDTIIGVASAALEVLQCNNMISAPFTRVNYYSNWIKSVMNNYRYSK